MKTINNTSAIKGIISALFICFAFTASAISAENKILIVVPDAISYEKDIEMENWMLNLSDWNTGIKAPDSSNSEVSISIESQKAEETKLFQKELQVTEVEKDIEVENWMTDLSNW